jgi:hypothetical protein
MPRNLLHSTILLAVLLYPAYCSSPTESDDAEARHIVRKVVEFLGGEHNVSRVRSIQERLSERHYDNDNRLVVNGETVRTIEFPDRIQFTLISPPVTKTLGPEGAFGVSVGRVFDLRAESATMLDDLKRSVINIAQHASDPKYLFRIAGSKRSGRSALTLIDIDADGAKTQWAVDANTGQIVSVSEDYNNSLLAGRVHQSIEFTKYKRFGDVNLPAAARIRQDFSHAYSVALERHQGQQGGRAGVNYYGVADLSLEKVNLSIPESTFHRPAQQPQ